MLRQDAVGGPQLLFLVPEQASLQMEQSLLEVRGESHRAAASGCPNEQGAGGAAESAGEVTAYHRAQVVSFQRLAHLVLQEANLPARQALSEPARVMVLRHLVHRLRPKLAYYRRAERLGGFLDQLGQTITELIQESVKPDDLCLPQRAEAEDARQGAKLHDLQLIYAEYLTYLGAERIDPSQHLELARKHLLRCSWLRGALMWVDGFASFSEQETAMLLELAGMCAETQVTALLEPAMARGLKPDSSPLFRRTLETLQRIRRRFQEAGIREIAPLVLAPPELPRFSLSPSLLQLERAVFQPEIRTVKSVGGDMQETVQRASTGDQAASGTPRQEDGRGAGGAPRQEDDQAASGIHGPPLGVRVVELPSLRVEVDYAVAQICRWVQRRKQPLRYRDTAIIVRDLDVYHDLLRNALASRNIPFFIDKRRPLTHHPLVELVRAAARMIVENASPAAMRQFLKTDLLPLSASGADAIENHLLATGIVGFAAWQETWRRPSRKLIEDREEFDRKSEAAEYWVEGARCRLWERIGDWVDFASQRQPRTGAVWASGLRELLRKLEAGRVVARWTRQAEEMGDLAAADEHRQAWEAVFSLLDDLAFTFETVPLVVDDLGDVLESALATLTLGLVPPTVDQVLVGAIERSRHPDIKAAVLVGFNDGVFPKRATEDSILNDDDRMLLRGRGLSLAPPTRERVSDESLLAYIALTRASEELVVTYSTTDAGGKPLRCSPFVAELQRAVPGLAIEQVAEPVQSRAMWDVLSTVDLRRRLAEEFRTRPAVGADDPHVRARWNSVYAGTRNSLIKDSASQIALRALDPPQEPTLSADMARRCFPAPLQTSVSQLEMFAACSFKHFAKYVLRLREREDADLQAFDVGNVHHAVLAAFTRRLMERNRAVGEIDEGEIEDHLRESCESIAGKLTHSTASARDAYVLGRLSQRLARVIRSQIRRQKGQLLKPRAAELAFGFDRGGLPAIKLTTPSGRSIELRGFIDHVDLFELADEMLGLVIDYKNRKTTLDMSKVFHGVSLQLLAYLLALQEVGHSLGGRPIRPAGALYLGVQLAYKRVDHPSLLSERHAELCGVERPRGVLLGEALDSLNPEMGESTRFSVFRKRDGTFGHLDRTDVVPTGREFNSLLAHTRQKLGELADGVLEGQVAVNPCRIGKYRPCSWCEMAEVCRFEMGLCDARFLEPLKRVEVLGRISTAAQRES